MDTDEDLLDSSSSDAYQVSYDNLHFDVNTFHYCRCGCCSPHHNHMQVPYNDYGYGRNTRASDFVSEDSSQRIFGFGTEEKSPYEQEQSQVDASMSTDRVVGGRKDKKVTWADMEYVGTGTGTGTEAERMIPVPVASDHLFPSVNGQDDSDG